MPSNYDNELGIELQAAGENLNTWGAPKLNNALLRLNKGIAGFLSIALTADKTLSSSNTSTTATDYEARHGALKFTGTGSYTVTVPSTARASYRIWNALTGVLTVTTGAGDTATLASGEICDVLCDATNVKKVKVTDYGSSLLVTTGVPTNGSHLVNKTYVDGLAFGATDLPGQGVGTVGHFVRSDGSAASWQPIAQSDVTNLTSDLAALSAADTANLTTATARAIAFAVAL